MSDYTSIGERIRVTRKRLHLTQLELAAMIGYARATLAGVESGKDEPGYKFLVAVADAFGVPLDWLSGRVVPRGGPLVAEVAQTPSEIEFLRFWRSLTLRQRNRVVTLLEKDVSLRPALAGTLSGKKSSS